MMNYSLILSVGIGGFIGAILRFTLSGWIQRLTGSSFPLGTLFVNIMGSFFIGFLFLYFQQTNLSVAQKALFLTGLLGALTTFSTFSLETLLLMEHASYSKAFLNIILNVLLSLGATFMGIMFFKRMW